MKEYTYISNEILQSEILTPEEKSILIYLLSLPKDFIIVKTNIWKNINIGRNRFDTNWKGLVEKGYIHSFRVKDPNSNLVNGWKHIVYEEPTNNSTQQKIEKEITDREKLDKVWEMMYGPDYKILLHLKKKAAFIDNSTQQK
jgi:hypothetical protein